MTSPNSWELLNGFEAATVIKLGNFRHYLLSSPALQLLHPALLYDEQTPGIYLSHFLVTPRCILYIKEEEKKKTPQVLNYLLTEYRHCSK